MNNVLAFKVPEKVCSHCSKPARMMSRQESKVYALIIAGMGTHEIAAKLFKSPKTIQTYKYRIMAKFGIEGAGNSACELLRFHVNQLRVNMSMKLFAGDVSPEHANGYLAAIEQVLNPDVSALSHTHD